MIIYNVTSSVDKEIADDWISWMKTKRIPELLRMGLFTDCKILKVITHEEEETLSFAVQYYTNTINDVEVYLTLDDETQKRYGNKVLNYHTLLEEV